MTGFETEVAKIRASVRRSYAMKDLFFGLLPIVFALIARFVTPFEGTAVTIAALWCAGALGYLAWLGQPVFSMVNIAKVMMAGAVTGFILMLPGKHFVFATMGEDTFSLAAFTLMQMYIVFLMIRVHTRSMEKARLKGYELEAVKKEFSLS